VIFSYIILQDVFYGGLTAAPDNGWLAYGVVALPVSAGAPAFDPASSPAAVWLFVGLGTIETQQLRFMSPEEYRVQLVGPKRPLETETRRHNGLSESQRVWFVAQPVSALNSGFPVWRAIVQGGVLYSEPGP
jgi:hypothetical protein